MKIDLNRGWSFIKTCSEAFISGAELEGISEVELPHTVSVTPFDYFDESEYQTVCCYRRRLDVPAEWIGKRIFLCIGAAAHFAEVFLNGEKLSEHRSGYTAFKTELTERLRAGENLLAIRVDSRETLDQPPFGFVIDYMTYGGLYREAWLEVREKTFIEDVFVKPEGSGCISAEVTVSGPADGMTLRHTVLDGERVIAQKECGVNNAPEFRAEGITKWSLDEPKLYTFRTELRSGSETVDVFETRIGFRDASFLEDGFYLNGERIRIRGLNRHQSYPFVGYAMPANVQRFDADILKNELGCNAVRTSHYPQSQAFIDRCDELGLLVFTEIPGWQHIGGEDWKQQALENVREMILQYRNHPSIVLWGVRINESNDDDALYEQTNELAHRLDPTRQTGGVRCIKKSNLLEDVYTYNDFLHEGGNKGCEPKKNVTSDVKKPYLVTEYCGHMFPTKTFDCEEHRLEHALRHANVLDAAAGTEGLAGSFGWCMFDYNTHMDFGSGDRICYHGVLDMFRNKKLAAEVYASQQDERPVLELSSLMDIGEHPAANRGKVFALTNADAVRLYKNGSFIAEFPKSHTPYKNLAHPPIDIDDFIGDAIEKNEPFKPKQAAYVKDLINYSSRFGFSHLTPKHYLKAAWLMLRYRMSFTDAYALYGKYNSNWGDAATTYRIEAVKDGKTVGVIEKGPAKSVQLTAEASADTLNDGASYDAALVRIALRDQYGSVLSFANEAVSLETEGPIALIGPKLAMLRGGLGGTFVKTVGGAGKAALKLRLENGTGAEARIEFNVTADRPAEQ